MWTGWGGWGGSGGECQNSEQSKNTIFGALCFFRMDVVMRLERLRSGEIETTMREKSCVGVAGGGCESEGDGWLKCVFRVKIRKINTLSLPYRERAFILMTWHAIARRISNSERSFSLLLLCAPLLAAAIPPITPLTPLLAKLSKRLSILHIVRCTSCVRMAQKREKEYTSASPGFESKFAGSKNTIFFHPTYNFIWNSYKVRWDENSVWNGIHRKKAAASEERRADLDSAQKFPTTLARPPAHREFCCLRSREKWKKCELSSQIQRLCTVNDDADDVRMSIIWGEKVVEKRTAVEKSFNGSRVQIQKLTLSQWQRGGAGRSVETRMSCMSPGILSCRK